MCAFAETLQDYTMKGLTTDHKKTEWLLDSPENIGRRNISYGLKKETEDF